MKILPPQIGILIVILTIILSSCDPGVSYDKVVENTSDYDLIVRVYPDSNDYRHFYYETNSFFIAKHSQVTIAGYHHIGEVGEFKGCDTYADSIMVEIPEYDSLALTLELNQPINWTFHRLEKSIGGGGVCECRIIVSNNNIQ